MYKIIIIGGGPGGYVAAIKAAQLGAKVALIEKHKIGGVCLNYGCIPTKTLLRSAKLYDDILKASSFGIDIVDVNQVSINWPNMMKRKDKVVSQLVGGVEQLLKHNGVEVITATDTSCLMHLEGLINRNKQPLKVLHIAEILNSSI